MVVACNTASAVALDTLREDFQVSIVGVIEPGAKRAIEMTQNGHIGVVGTEGTVRSGAYERALKAIRPDVKVSSVACPLFVPLAEEGWANHEVALLAAKDYLAPLLVQGVDTLVLGCTHYPLLKQTLQKVVGEKVQLVDSAKELAKTVSSLLESKQLLRQREPVAATSFYVTDIPTRFERVGGAFLGETLDNVTTVSLDEKI
jgi:glutamate racemase